MTRALVWLAAAACLAGCRASGDAHPEVAFRSIARGYQTGLPGTGIQVARDATEWRALWNRHASTVIPRPDPPRVDFGTEMVVCVLLGSRPSFGYAIEISRVVIDAPRGVRVEASARSPAEGAITSPVVTQPFHMIAMPRRAGPVDLVVR